MSVISLEPETGAVRWTPVNGGTSRELVAVIRDISPRLSYRLDGGSLRLAQSTALELFERRGSLDVAWSDDAAAYIGRFAAGYSRRNAALRRLDELSNANPADLLANYAQGGVLDPHQRVAVSAMTDELIDGLCLFDEQGSGKTVMTIHAFDRLSEHDAASKLLIFAPKNMLPTWASDFERFLGSKYALRVVSGSRAEKLAILSSPGSIFVTNFESADSMEDSLRSLILRNSGHMTLVVDESFFIKNRNAVRSAAIRRLRNYCDRCWMLCGTPAPNAAVDVVHQFDVADCGVTFSNADLPKDPRALRAAIESIVENRGLFLRRLKRDILPNLPPKNFESISIPMTWKQSALYQEMLTELIDDVAAADERGFRELFTSFLARRMALLQIACNPRLVSPDFAETPPKQTALDRLLHELISERGEKVVLWSYFRGSLDDLCSRYSGFGIARLDGSVSSIENRGAAVQRFQADPDTRLFIANPAAAGAGITLTASRIAVYESFPTQTAHFLQSVDRIHRRGQTRNTHYYFLLAQDSLEEIEYERLLEKDRMGFRLFGDEPPEMDRREVLLRELQNALARLR